MAYKLLFACYGFIMYIVKLFVPYQLNHFYPYPKIENGLPIIFYITPLLTIASLVWVWIKRHNRILVFGFLFYIINIALVLQVLQVGWAVMAERYTYVPYIGLFFILAYGVDSFINRLNNPLHKRLSLAATGLIILGFAFLSFQRVDVWQDSRTLWSDNLSKTPNSTAYNNLANFYIGLNKPDSSVIFYNRALEIDPSHSKAHKNLGVVYIFQKKYDAAISHLKQAIALSPTYTNAYLQLGKAYINKQQYNNALEPLNHYIRQMPNDAYAYNARAMCYHLSGNPSMAVPDYNLAIKNNQGNGLYYYNRAQALESLGRKKEALSDALKAKSLGHKFDESFIKRLQ
jgi:tetratricopeptide (TPR) repeat protein